MINAIGGTVRVPAIDIARALIIIGVVFSHVINGLAGAGILHQGSPVVTANEALSIFRMPALAFMLGLFVPGGVARRGSHGYIRERVTLALYLYVVWFFVQILAEIATSNVKNSPRGWEDLLMIWSMPAHLWFLPYLALSATAVSVLLPLNTTRVRWVPLGLMAALAIAFWGYNPPFFGLRGLSLVVFTLAGAMVGLLRLSGSLTGHPLLWLVSGTGCVALFVPLFSLGMVPASINGEGHPGFAAGLSAVGAILGIVAVLALAVALSYVSMLGQALSVIGKYTLEIYLGHVAIAAGVRISFDKLGVHHASMIIVASLIIGVSVPMLAAFFGPRMRMAWLFRPPARLEAWSKAANLSRISAQDVDSRQRRRPSGLL